jgi:hypothetical protein
MAKKAKELPSKNASTQIRSDGWASLVTGLGTSMDKRMASQVLWQALSFMSNSMQAMSWLAGS